MPTGMDSLTAGDIPERGFVRVRSTDDVARSGSLVEELRRCQALRSSRSGTVIERETVKHLFLIVR